MTGTPDEDLPHRYDIEILFDSEVATGTKLYFCAGCGRPRSPKMRRFTHDTPCEERSEDEVKERIRSRVSLLSAMVGGGHIPSHGPRKFKRSAK